MSSAAQSARGASRGWHWKPAATVMLASMMPTVVLLIASLPLLDLTPLTKPRTARSGCACGPMKETTGLCRP
ncbi:IncQ-type mobilization protein MobB [Klebsiella aerogenes]